MAHKWYEGSWCSEDEVEEREDKKFKISLMIASLVLGLYLLFNGSPIFGSIFTLIFVVVYWKQILYLSIFIGMIFVLCYFLR